MGSISIYSRLASGAATVFCTFALLILGGCLGGGGGEEDTINGQSVPIEPDSTENNATLAGVDSNSNGVRDDVERNIAETFGSNSDNYTAVMARAKGYQEWLSNPTPTDRAQALALFAKVECFSAPDYTYYEEIFNTAERKVVYEKVSESVLGFMGSELQCAK